MCTALCLFLFFAPLLAEEPEVRLDYTFGKYPGGVYIGGTSGLTGIDSIQGFTDSLFYLKWAESYQPDLSTSIQRVIYGDDDRRDIYTLTDTNYLRLAQATCLIISSSEYSDNGNGTFDLSSNPWTSVSGVNLCAEERFIGQMRMGNCSGFLVAPDLVVTAGHCMSSCGNWSFLFGYEQTDSLTPPAQTVSADNLYFCLEVVEQAYTGDYDYCLVRLDRPVVGRTPLPIRRSGSVSATDPLVMVGHPKGLPMKLAAGAEVKDAQLAEPWFQANLDSYAGNSGSVVVNTDTWRIEGILVRGAPDFVFDGGCAASYVVPNTGNTGSGLLFEEVSKIETIASFIPELVLSDGDLELNQLLYNCTDQVAITLRDIDLASTGSINLLVTTSSADSELVALVESPGGSGVFGGTIDIAEDPVTTYDGYLQATHADLVVVTYDDADDGSGSPAVDVVEAQVDCVAPVISNVTVADYGAVWATITFTTDEPVGGRLWIGETCGAYTMSEIDDQVTEHQITVSSLSPLTVYHFMIEATDVAGNYISDDNSGVCYSFMTNERDDFYTEQFAAGCDLPGQTLVFRPGMGAEPYDVCLLPSSGLPIPATGPSVVLGDDDFQYLALADGKEITYFGISYSGLYVGSNGYVTFGQGDVDWSETIAEHFNGPPRVAVFWDDLNPDGHGRVSYEQLHDQFLVTWHSIPEVSSSRILTAQVQFFFDGTIAITYVDVESSDGIVGLSPGTGLDPDFLNTDLSAYDACNLITCYIDGDGDSFGAVGDWGHFEIGPECASGASPNVLDCDDSDENSYPEAPEIEDDQIDQDCDGYDATCCVDRVGDVNNSGVDEPTIGDVSRLIDYLFITQDPVTCMLESDINQSGGRYPGADDISIGDISLLIDYLFVSGTPIPPCLLE